MGVGGAGSLCDGKRTGYREAFSELLQWGQRGVRLRMAFGASGDRY